jgi:hypothetical protein
MVISVDGYINGPGGEFIAPAWSADLDAWTASHAARDICATGALASHRVAR